MDAWDDLQRIGVGYLENYGEGVDAEFPHSFYTFELSVDRDVMTAKMRDANDEVTVLCSVETRKSTLAAAFEELSQKLVDRFSST